MEEMRAYECVACETTFKEEDGEHKNGYLVCPSCGDEDLVVITQEEEPEQEEEMDELYTVVDEDIGIISCNACGASTIDGNRNNIKHYKTCGGVKEMKKWERYYEEMNQEEKE